VKNPSNRAVAIWLLVICALVFAMVVVGGITRLTHSGLSMVEWEPIMGAVLPMSQVDWQATFDAYKKYPEYQLLNRDMSLAEFKSIFLFEYSHRLLGRLIGVVFLLPLLVFMARRRIPPGYAPKLIGLFVLGGLQGLLGWYMVKSGLVDRPDVSQYRLTAHLMVAFVTYGFAFWLALSLLSPSSRSGPRRLAWFVVVLILLQVASGGLVAGTDAGFLFNTFPTMNGAWIPDNLWLEEPTWINVFENRATIQFDHRVLAYLLVLSVLALWWRGPRGWRVNLLLLAVFAQAGLGVATLLAHVPVWLGALHQAGALVLLTASLLVCHGLRASPTTRPGASVPAN